ncbi:MAG: alpha/beta fold hydrolase [Cytophagales bacterium]|nr:alpha/beta fold hydrolase [Bernardetiaceae bacterium]MDW8205674.1 alpha/beta fold hydrolase [Cytophagales bacterium]
MKMLRRSLVIFAVLYALLCAAAYFGQTYVIFHPVPLPSNHVFRFEAHFDEYTLFTPDGEQLNLLHFKHSQQPSKGVVLYYHGNADNLERWGKYSKTFLSLGYDFIVWDYRGYGKSTGFPTTENMHNDAELVYQFVRKRYKPTQIIIYGRSLGTGLAAYVASRYAAKRLILETPYHSFAEVAHSYVPFLPYSGLLRYEFPTYRYLATVQCPVTIFHGTADELLPFSSTEKLKTVLKPTDDFIVVQGGKHHDLAEYEQYRSHLRAILR